MTTLVNATTTTSTQYYHFNGQRIAMRQNGVLTYLHGDHLGSASLATTAAGAQVSAQRYLPYGATRADFAASAMPTDRQFTGQRHEATLGFYDYNARQYDPVLGRFLQADSIVPQPGNPQSLNRYAYVLNNPLRYTDPSGHLSEDQILQLLGDQGHLLDYWKNYDPYFYEILLAMDDGDTLTASDVLGSLQCWIKDGIAELKAFRNATTNLWDWQGGGGYILRGPGATDIEAWNRSRDIFNKVATGSGLGREVMVPIVSYSDRYGRLVPSLTGIMDIGLVHTEDVTGLSPSGWYGVGTLTYGALFKPMGDVTSASLSSLSATSGYSMLAWAAWTTVDIMSSPTIPSPVWISGLQVDQGNVSDLYSLLYGQGR